MSRRFEMHRSRSTRSPCLCLGTAVLPVFRSESLCEKSL